jgi:hypothetical protein
MIRSMAFDFALSEGMGLLHLGSWETGERDRPAAGFEGCDVQALLRTDMVITAVSVRASLLPGDAGLGGTWGLQASASFLIFWIPQRFFVRFCACGRDWV